MRGLSPLVTTAIVLAVSVSIAVFVAFYYTGIMGSSGFGTRPIKLQVFNPMVMGKVVTVMVKNLGGDRVYISSILINNRECEVRLAYDTNNPESYVKVYPPGKELSNDPFKIDPGETIEAVLVTPMQLKAGNTYQIKVRTSQGLEYVTQLYVAYTRPATAYRINLIAFTDCNNTNNLGCCESRVFPNNITGIKGWLISFDIATWRYYCWQVKNVDPNYFVTNPSEFILIGKDGAEGTIENPPPPKYEGRVPVLATSEYSCRAIGGPADGVPDTPNNESSPIIVVVNVETEKRDFNFTWINMDNKKIDRFVMEKLSRGIAGLDFLILWEDLWDKPKWWYKGYNDPRAYMDHVVRVTWLKTGDVRIGIYRCSGCYLHVFLLGNEYIYFKPHGASWEPSKYSWSEGSIRVHIEIGYDGDTWPSPSGYPVHIWIVKG